MKTIHTQQDVVIPTDVTLTINKRIIKVKGPKGEVVRSFKHVQVDIFMVGKKRLRVEKWFGTRRELATVRTVCSHIANMIKGVRFGYLYKMKSVYAHFPINITTKNDGKVVEVRNFLGEKMIREVQMAPGVTFSASGNKDEYIVQGIDLENVSKSAARIHHSSRVRDKDIRKFLDGVYVSEKTTITPIVV